MPLAAIIPAVVGIASLVASNGQQKAAAKNNQNQQQGAVDNARAANAAGQQQLSDLVSRMPSPFAGQTIRRPGAGGYAPHMPAAPQPMPQQAAPPPSMAGAVLGGSPAGSGYRTQPGDPRMHLPAGIGMRIL